MIPANTVEEMFEYTFSSFLTSSIYQRHPLLRETFQLRKIAEAYAKLMATSDTFGHVGPDGSTANERVRAGGFSLPSYYPVKGNTVESLAAGHLTASAAWDALMGSPAHRAHLLGEDGFVSQSWFGVGYYFDLTSKYKGYLVVLITAQGEHVSGE